MATLLVTSRNIARPVRFSRLAYYPEGAGQTFKLGQLVAIAAGAAVAGATDPTAGTLIGLAAEAATGVTGNMVGVWVADQNAKGNILRVDKSDTTNTRVVITRLVDAVGDINGRVEFRFLAAARGPFA